MSEYFTSMLVALTSFFAVLICIIGLSTVLSQQVKAETTEINTGMEQLEKLYNELYTFHKTQAFHKWGYGTMGEGEWAGKLEVLHKSDALKVYIKTFVPESMETEFLFLQPLEPNHLWFLGRRFMKNGGKENKDTLIVKDKFRKLFELHKSRTK